MDKFYVPSVFTLFVWILRHFITHRTLVKSRVIAVHVAARKLHASFSRFSRACPLGQGKKAAALLVRKRAARGPQEVDDIRETR